MERARGLPLSSARGSVSSKGGTAVYNGVMSTEAIILPPGGGRAYDLGPMRGVFKADGPETQDRYCASEWSVEPGRPGPGPHHHEANEEIFLVTEGTMSFMVGEEWVEAPTGTFLRVRRA